MADYIKNNQKAWDEVAEAHEKARPELHSQVQNPNFNSLHAVELEELKKFDWSKKRAAHLCCNNGKDSISLSKLGFDEVVGFDFSQSAIDKAKELAIRAKSKCTFVWENVLEIDSKYNSSFDLVYVNVGGIVWIPDYLQLTQKIFSILKPNGVFFLYEIHPFTTMLGIDISGEKSQNDKYRIIESYFKKEPILFEKGLNYLEKRETNTSNKAYFFHRNLGEIISNTVQSGLQLTSFKEYKHDISAVLPHLEKDGLVPLSYILKAVKPHTQN